MSLKCRSMLGVGSTALGLVMPLLVPPGFQVVTVFQSAFSAAPSHVLGSHAGPLSSDEDVGGFTLFCESFDPLFFFSLGLGVGLSLQRDTEHKSQLNPIQGRGTAYLGKYGAGGVPEAP